MNTNSFRVSDLNFKFSIDQVDKNSIKEILSSSGYFYDYEVEVALEIADDYLNNEDHNAYHFIAAMLQNQMIGFSCYGHIPCTKGSYDLYWIAIHNKLRGKGIGIKLLQETEKQVQIMGGKKIYIETSSTEKYASTQRFYLRQAYALEARLKDYYREGDDKLVFSKSIKLIK
jgi:ribosomal protein S18 acetylase RimI-like enzyme